MQFIKNIFAETWEFFLEPFWHWHAVFICKIVFLVVGNTYHLAPFFFHCSIHMSAYENVVGGKLKLKGKALDVKAGGVKKKKKNRQLSDQMTQTNGNEIAEGGSIVTITEEDTENGLEESSGGGGGGSSYVDNLTPAERRYMEQRQKIDMHKMAKTSNKSHRDRISDFNQYLANMSEHYDIPKVGPG